MVLTWSANSESDIASYKVYGGTSSSPTTLLSTITAGMETYTNTGLTNGTTYYYRISAADDAGNESSKSSDVSTSPKPQEYTVKKDGSGDYTVIQTAIDAILDGDTVLVYAGTYTENINYNGKNIVVGSLYLTTQDTSYISSTIINGNQAGSVVTFESGEGSTAVLSGFKITNGSSTYGGGIKIENSSSPKLNHLIIKNNSATSTHSSYGGGGLYIGGYSDVTITYVKIINNSSSSRAGGIWNRHGSII
ncbi:MAG TPA: hypothetical protein EYO20_04220 [Gemmatimonadetes bacterium]|nr:hypothetical protein [Gemmatimonadota bacterium]